MQGAYHHRPHGGIWEGAAPSAEWVQALYTARQQVNTWIDAENAVINGLLSETTRRGVFNDIDVVIAEMPGLIPAWDYLFEGYKLDETSDLETMAYLFTAVQKYKQDHAAQQQEP